MIDFNKKFIIGDVIELITASAAYVCKFESEMEGELIVKDAFVINIVPIQTEQGQFSQMPRLEPRNIYSIGSDWKFKGEDVVYCEKISGTRFIDMYIDAVNGYNEVKTREGSNIDIVQTMPKGMSIDESLLQ